MWNGHCDALERPNRAVPDRGSILKNNQFAVLLNILSIVGVIGAPCILIPCMYEKQFLLYHVNIIYI